MPCRVALEARGLGPISINIRITAVRKLAVEAADNGLLAPELASGIARITGVRSLGVRVGNWLSLQQAQALLNAPDIRTTKGLRDRAMFAVLLGCGLRRSEVAALTMKHIQMRDSRWCIVDLVGKHANGEGVAKDAAQAVNWYRKAADQGHSRLSFWASAIWVGVMLVSSASLAVFAISLPCAAAKLRHM